MILKLLSAILAIAIVAKTLPAQTLPGNDHGIYAESDPKRGKTILHLARTPIDSTSTMGLLAVFGSCDAAAQPENGIVIVMLWLRDGEAAAPGRTYEAAILIDLENTLWTGRAYSGSTPPRGFSRTLSLAIPVAQFQGLTAAERAAIAVDRRRFHLEGTLMAAVRAYVRQLTSDQPCTVMAEL